jgi:hypothetical protein
MSSSSLIAVSACSAQIIDGLAAICIFAPMDEYPAELWLQNPQKIV